MKFPTISVVFLFTLLRLISLSESTVRSMSLSRYASLAPKVGLSLIPIIGIIRTTVKKRWHTLKQVSFYSRQVRTWTPRSQKMMKISVTLKQQQQQCRSSRVLFMFMFIIGILIMTLLPIMIRLRNKRCEQPHSQPPLFMWDLNYHHHHRRRLHRWRHHHRHRRCWRVCRLLSLSWRRRRRRRRGQLIAYWNIRLEVHQVFWSMTLQEG